MLIFKKNHKNDELTTKKSTTNSRAYRESNIELFRFLLALGVVFWHVNTGNVSPKNWLFVNLNYFSWLPVTTFALLSGYLSINSNKNRFLKFLPIVIFYYIMNIAIGYPMIYFNNFGNREPLKHIFTFGGQHWWFLWAILGTYLITPGINFLVKNTNKWLSLTTIWIVIILFFIFSGIQYSSTFSFQNVGILGIVYALGAWWKLNGGIFEKHKKGLLITCATYFLIIIIVSNVYFYITNKVIFYYSVLMVFIILGSLFLFILYKEIKIKHNKVLNYLGWLSLPIYLFHYLGQFLVSEKIMPFFTIPNLELESLVVFLLVSFFTILLAIVLTFFEFHYTRLINFMTYKIKISVLKIKKEQNKIIQTNVA